uniref:Uncharacterized protein n=1 Tax=viral metagenome TaxID=1070528 RepID=A0A6C0JRV5_9ZZZZ
MNTTNMILLGVLALLVVGIVVYVYTSPDKVVPSGKLVQIGNVGAIPGSSAYYSADASSSSKHLYPVNYSAYDAARNRLNASGRYIDDYSGACKSISGGPCGMINSRSLKYL